jgi:lysophospholipid acyltransferase (LPLAT)-like uncharacterized protein
LAPAGDWATTPPLNPPADIPSAPANPHAHQITSWRSILLWPLAALFHLWGRTLRIEIDEADRRLATRAEEPMAIVLWHNRLFMASVFYRRFRTKRQCYALISSSKDGAWLDAFFTSVNLKAVRGSSSRHGREAAAALVDVMRAGNDIGITPDGPRGPCYEVKPGTLIVTRRLGAPLLLLGWEYASAWRLRSWDGFYVPRPFSRVRLRCDFVTGDENSGDRDAAAARVRDRLLAINPDLPPPDR